MTLSTFIEMAIEAMGGVVIPLEYALCTVMIPEEYKESFQGKTEILMAFDYEVAQENPGSEFVTYGSYLFDTIMQIAKTTPTTSQRYAYVDRLEFNYAAEKIKKHLQMDGGSVNVVSEAPKIGMWCLYHFLIQYLSDERFEETAEVWVDLTNGRIDNDIVTNAIFYDTTQPRQSLPYLKPKDVRAAYLLAYERAASLASDKSIVESTEIHLKADINRISHYYDEMIAENKKRAGRKGVTEERLTEIAQKSQALLMEKNKQIHEIKEKYTVKTSILLENAIMYHIPVIEILAQVSYRREKYEAVFYYDPIFKRIINGVRD